MMLSGVVSLSFSPVLYSTAETVTEINGASEFISKISQNPSGNFKLAGNIDFNDGLISLNNIVFQGTLDGNGYAIKNFKLEANGNQAYYGVFASARGATISNLKLEGKSTVTLSTSVSQLYVGMLVGHGDNVSISNCEFDLAVSVDEPASLAPISITYSRPITFGGVAGHLIGGSKVTNCVNHGDFNLDSENVQDSSENYFGGIVGSLNNSEISYCVNYGAMQVESRNETEKSFIGGLVGEATNSVVYNCAFGGEAVDDTYNATREPIIAKTTSSNVHHNHYYSDSFAQENGQALSQSFFEDISNWDRGAPRWDFNQTWFVSAEDAQLYLQNFANFYLSFDNTRIDSGLNILNLTSCVIDDGVSQYYGGTEESFHKKITLQIRQNEPSYDFYELNVIYLDDKTVWTKNTEENSKLYTVEAEKSEEGKIIGYNISFSTDAQTSGISTENGRYAFNFVTRPFACLVTIDVTENAKERGVSAEDLNAQGLIGVSGSAEGERNPKIDLNLSLDTPATVYALKSREGIWSFSHWEIDYWGDDGWGVTGKEEIDEDTENLFSESQLSLVFGYGVFTSRFRLRAIFTDEQAINVSFTDYDTELADVEFYNQEYTGEAISTVSSGTVVLKITVKKGFELLYEEFIKNITEKYPQAPDGEELPDPMPTAPKIEDNQTVYTFSINMGLIKQQYPDEVTFTFYLQKSKDDSGDNLLWLWITIPCVALLLIALLVFVIVFVKRRNKVKSKYTGGGKDGKNKNKQQKQKENKKSNYRDYYY